MKSWLLRIHRWIALVFALPLLVVIGTGLILSFEPWVVTRAIEPGTLTVEKVQELLAKHDPNGEARAIVHRSYDHTLTIGAGRGAGRIVDTGSGIERKGPSPFAELLGATRQLHERLMMNAEWVVVSSTVAMLTIIALGILMGWPRIANTLAGWHKATAWCLLPLVVLSPLTGLLMAGGVTFTGTAAAEKSAPLPLVEAVRIVARDHDLSGLVWLRERGGRMLARIVENGEYRIYTVTPQSAVPQPRNWPRLWHEGNFAGGWSSAMNIILSVALLGLLVTGVWIWVRRQMKQRARQVPAGARQQTS